MKKQLLISTLILSACASETIFNQTDSSEVWVLQSLNTKTVPAKITLTFPEKGQISGQAPCNHYSARQKAPLPWFEAGPIRATRRACDKLALEQSYFEALSSMTLIERKAGFLLLTNEKDQSLLFTQQ
jgi:heat shock protein HslJ